MEVTIIQGRRHRIGMSGSARILGLDLERLPIGVVCSLLKGSTKKKKGEYLILRIDY